MSDRSSSIRAWLNRRYRCHCRQSAQGFVRARKCPRAWCNRATSSPIR